MNALRTAIFVVLFMVGQEFLTPGLGLSIWANERESTGDSCGSSTEKAENQPIRHFPGVILALERVFSYYNVIQHRFRYGLMDLQNLRETDSPAPDFEPSAFSRYLTGISCFEDRRATRFEIFQPKLERKEMFFSFHLAFHPKEHRLFLEMTLTPSAEADINFWVPLSSDR